MKKEYTVIWGNKKITIHFMSLKDLKKFVKGVLDMEDEFAFAKIFKQEAKVESRKTSDWRNSNPKKKDESKTV
ncbi:hypothetical protein C5B42_04440 [Candidatus Cerribacteria bacterium 'Amazon FNV 2010 28 9']|uniref:Uncharacterized protein n=1 Tax=Candidatus Cerribacteria bacterium 'Amazon FNV 2010 28 9' TaxID=2081795 RepID=A0A317JP97_9BACT|nr:MAG: hypothetical protein C5B42_04440 [Candidatus Cerribacteria bacterium 'Amazon FNV 2010 28 9']